ncbi:class I SAM-dependent methyltransferase [Glycomyces tenuis]|uniref:class I SAM-dependent methyltransferase n=1 Tax=Glycomyces tenuis TaxID=58116 RepID=UPI00041240F9|nr:class I SAM-dependent methyltransferase [Glycomyces tenuis]
MRTEPAWHTFERVADSYDEVLPFFTMIGEALVEALDPAPGTRMLDVGAGRGALVGPALRRGCAVSAVDASGAMVARLRAEHPEADARVMDAQDLDFADGAFELVTAAFVVHLLDDPARGAAEAFRVLAPGGRFAMTIGAAPLRPEPTAIQDAMDALFAEFSAYLPPEGGMGSAIAPQELLAEAGFVDVETRHTEVVIDVPDGDVLWDWALSHGYRAFIEDLPAERREEMRLRMRVVPGPGAVIQRANPLLIGRKP